ncbi:AlpA family transcriptional regulator [Massilia sp. Bi118]|uniref:helix-turn-helix transcriptional regulator n=1 Tax=Massilia sp. Bi118 TaxID=2822346 RepID=UPI001E57A3C9|nr:helix-turn-helix domain-containing protein [Massilia sp. Bi118]
MERRRERIEGGKQAERCWPGMEAGLAEAAQLEAAVGGIAIENCAAGGLAEAQKGAVHVSIDPDRTQATRMWYVSRFKLTSAFLSVSQLAMILGIAPSTIYTLIRTGRFFLPYRAMNASPRVWIDDLVAWHLSGDRTGPALGEKPSRPRAAAVNADAHGAANQPRALSRAEVDAAVSKAADDALRAAGIDPSTRRRPKTR